MKHADALLRIRELEEEVALAWHNGYKAAIIDVINLHHGTYDPTPNPHREAV